MAHSHSSAASGGSLHLFRLGAALLLSLIAFGAQLFGALLTGSISLLAESVHVAVDSLALSLAFGVALFSRRVSEARSKRLEVLSALVQSTLLIGVGIYAAIRGLRGLIIPHPIAGDHVLIFAAVGLLANLFAALILYQSRDHNLNLRAAFLEVVSDSLGSAVLILGAFAVILFGFYRADAIAALILAAFMIPRGFSLLRRSLAIGALRRRRLALSGALILSLIAGLGISQLHQHFLPSVLHLDPASLDSYSWSAEVPGSTRLTLDFDRKDSLATLSSGCAVARAPYQSTLGGAFFGKFYLDDKPSCADTIDPSVLALSTAYYSENSKAIELKDEAGNTVSSLSSSAQISDQELSAFWKPALEVLFKL